MIVTNIKELKKKCEPVISQDEVESIVKKLEETFTTLKGYGLAANQIGIDKQLAIVRMDKCILSLINPIIVFKENKYKFTGENCFSFPGLFIDTDRYEYVVVESGLGGDRRRFSFHGLEAAVIQHEIDHLMGITIRDRKHRSRK